MTEDEKLETAEWLWIVTGCAVVASFIAWVIL